jgi:hypothetical protein
MFNALNSIWIVKYVKVAIQAIHCFKENAKLQKLANNFKLKIVLLIMRIANVFNALTDFI